MGARAARQLHATSGLDSLVVCDVSAARASAVGGSLGAPTRVEPWSPALLDAADVVVLGSPGGHRSVAEAALERSVAVVSCCDDPAEVRSLLDLDPEARERGVVVVVGAAFSPGLTCLLARHAASDLTSVDEVHVARVGSGGPACQRTMRSAWHGTALEWASGVWSRRRAGHSPELQWFPDPIGGVDCSPSAGGEALVLQPAFPGVARVTARVGAGGARSGVSVLRRRDPRTVPEGRLGAVRVEVRGRRGTATDVRVLGALDRPAVAAGTVAAVAALWAVEGRVARAGAAGLAELVPDPVPFLHELGRRGIRAAVFEGAR